MKLKNSKRKPCLAWNKTNKITKSFPIQFTNSKPIKKSQQISIPIDKTDKKIVPKSIPKNKLRGFCRRKNYGTSFKDEINKITLLQKYILKFLGNQKLKNKAEPKQLNKNVNQTSNYYTKQIYETSPKTVEQKITFLQRSILDYLETKRKQPENIKVQNKLNGYCSKQIYDKNPKDIKNKVSFLQKYIVDYLKRKKRSLDSIGNRNKNSSGFSDQIYIYSSKEDTSQSSLLGKEFKRIDSDIFKLENKKDPYCSKQIYNMNPEFVENKITLLQRQI